MVRRAAAAQVQRVTRRSTAGGVLASLSLNDPEVQDDSPDMNEKSTPPKLVRRNKYRRGLDDLSSLESSGSDEEQSSSDDDEEEESGSEREEEQSEEEEEEEEDSSPMNDPASDEDSSDDEDIIQLPKRPVSKRSMNIIDDDSDIEEEDDDEEDVSEASLPESEEEYDPESSFAEDGHSDAADDDDTEDSEEYEEDELILKVTGKLKMVCAHDESESQESPTQKNKRAPAKQKKANRSTPKSTGSAAKKENQVSKSTENNKKASVDDDDVLSSTDSQASGSNGKAYVKKGYTRRGANRNVGGPAKRNQKLINKPSGAAVTSAPKDEDDTESEASNSSNRALKKLLAKARPGRPKKQTVGASSLNDEEAVVVTEIHSDDEMEDSEVVCAIVCCENCDDEGSQSTVHKTDGVSNGSCGFPSSPRQDALESVPKTRILSVESSLTSLQLHDEDDNNGDVSVASHLKQGDKDIDVTVDDTLRDSVQHEHDVEVDVVSATVDHASNSELMDGQEGSATFSNHTASGTNASPASNSFAFQDDDQADGIDEETIPGKRSVQVTPHFAVVCVQDEDAISPLGSPEVVSSSDNITGTPLELFPSEKVTSSHHSKNETEVKSNLEACDTLTERSLSVSNVLSEKSNLSTRVKFDLSANETKQITYDKGSKTRRREGSIRKWALGAQIGSGAFGVVHLGMNKHTGTLMAVKTVSIDRAVVKDIRREINMLRSLKHKNIVCYFGAEMFEGKLNIFQEWVAGGSVTGMLAKFGAFSLAVVASYISQALEGLAYIHDNGIMHRDIKGANLLVSDEGVVKLADFGASKRLVSDMMLTHTMRGTPYFMAPEVFEEKYSFKADVWSMGCVAFQMFTATPPWKSFGKTNPVALFNVVKNHLGPPPMDVPSTCTDSLKHISLFQSLMTRCFRLDPIERPSARELLLDPFFLHAETDDDVSVNRSLFSPCSMMSNDQITSPVTRAEPSLARRIVRSKSNSPLRSPFRSPPLPKRPSPGVMLDAGSPKLDSTDWPAWARDRHEKSRQLGLHRASLSDSTLGSLAYSADSNTTDSVLAGLAFV